MLESGNISHGHTFKSTILAFVKMMRVKNLVIMAFMQLFVSVFLVGPKEKWITICFSPDLLLLVFVTVLSAGAGYVINDYHDVKIDAINKPLRMVVDRIVSRQHTLIFYFSLNSVALILAFYVGFNVLMYVLCSQCILWAYSTYFKKSFLIGNIIVAAMTSFAVIIIALYFNAGYYWVSVFALFSFFMNLIREIIKDIEDLKGDSTFGARTIPIVWGVRKTKKLLFVLIALLLIVLVGLAFQERSGKLWVLALILNLTMGIFVAYLKRADTSKAFGKLSETCKIIMLLGILSMILI